MKLRPAELPARKSAFLTPGPDTRLEDEFADTHRLLAPFGYYSALLGQEIWVPKDFITDYASVPRLVGMYLLFGGKGKRAALIHDWLYSCAKLPRKVCDEVFKEALGVSGYSEFTIGAMYGGVRVGGGSHYTKENVPQEIHVAQAMDAASLVAP